MHHDIIWSFIAKLDLWKSRIQKGNSVSFSYLDSTPTDGSLETELKQITRGDE